MHHGMTAVWNTVDYAINMATKDPDVSILWRSDIMYSAQKGSDRILRGSKTIIGVINQDTADKITKSLRHALKSPELLVFDRKMHKERPYKLKVKTITCADDDHQLILHSYLIPVTKKHRTKQDIINQINKVFDFRIDLAKLNSLDIDWIKTQRDDTLKQLSVLSDTKTYRTSFYKSFASGYKVSYFDIDGRRKQAGVGDVLIAINGKKVVNDGRMFKRRTDAYLTKKPILHVDDFFGIYPDIVDK